MMAKTVILRSIFIAYVALTSLLFMSECGSPDIDGFTTDLIHRDSPQSPTYDPSLSPSERLVNALKRSFSRAQRFKKSQSGKSAETGLIPEGGEYLMKFAVGNPPVPSIAIADTGSDIIWMQCLPCDQCFNQSLPLFSPKSSHTYRSIPCNTTECASLGEASCSSPSKSCRYSEVYGDGSFTQGELAMDTFSFAFSSNKSTEIPKIIFGCGTRNGGLFSGTESGIVGLGGGKASLVRQLGSTAQGKFSYCLQVPSISGQSNSSKLIFGASATVSGAGAVSTPLVKKDPETFYYLTLEGISVGNQKIEFYNRTLSDSEEGNMIIDSGTTITMLPQNFYDKLERAVKGSVKQLKQIEDPEGTLNKVEEEEELRYL